MPTKYVILYKGTDYNDEYYSIGGDNAKVEKIGYDSLEIAKHELRNLYREEMKHHSLYDFEEGGPWFIDEAAEWFGYPENYDYWDAASESYGRLIEEAEKRDRDWLTMVPQLYEIVEVTF